MFRLMSTVLRFIALSLVVLWCGVTLPVAAIEDSLVQRYFRDLRSLRAEFVQQVYDADSRPLQISSGRMYMQKPGRFRWDYDRPFPQVVVADGGRLWHYDSELEQVTVRELDSALGSTPLALLSGAAPIEQAFAVSEERSDGGLRWFELTPRQGQPDFRLLRVAFRGEILDTIELEDAFDQRTRLRFSRLERNVSIDPRRFRFKPPAGVDVVGELP